MFHLIKSENVRKILHAAGFCNYTYASCQSKYKSIDNNIEINIFHNIEGNINQYV